MEGRSEPRQRVVVYCTRRHEERVELLVFEHRDFPEAGTQVPAGGIESGESAEQAAVRELLEETSVAVEAANLLGFAEEDHPNGYRCHNSYFHVEPDQPTPQAWWHHVSAGDEDEGLVFRCSFVPLRHAQARLHESQLAFLTELERATSAT